MGKKKLIFGAVIVVAGLVLLFLPGYSKLQDLRTERQIYRQRIALLEQYNLELERKVARMKDDPHYLEKKARDKLGIIRKGEVVYRPD